MSYTLIGPLSYNRFQATGAKDASLAATVAALNTAIAAVFNGTDKTHPRYEVTVSVKPMQV